ncbi:hypothetical protein [Sporosarcina koreensis]|uniref:hypothetical protein n=1 Tax=Sporosarcina koreensis TaxID=334735 RepID=UPI00058ACD1F|nr:hypothetical protein [Sporosarcina koreensis]
MNIFLLGVLLVFAKTNLQLLDMGVFFYSTNAVGYALICIGLRQMGDSLPRVRRLLPAAGFMVLHSIGFAVLNGTGHSLQTIALSSGAATAAALLLAVLAVTGLGMIFYIIHEVFVAIQHDETVAFTDIGFLEKMPGLLLLLLILTTVLFFTVPTVASVLLLLLLAGEVILLVQLSAKVRPVF